MSHEIRTPLNGILGMLQLLETSTLDNEQRDHVVLATKSAWGLLQLLNDLLDLSRIESGHLLLREEAFDLRELVRNSLALFLPVVQEKGVQLHSRVDPALPEQLRGDATRIRQILFNLVGNAVKFTAEGEVEVEVVRIRGLDAGQVWLRIRVSDSGIGLSTSMLERAFEPFVQGEGVYQRNFQGAGLGLSIVKRLALLMDGRVGIENRVTGGAAVTVEILVSEVPAAPSVRMEEPSLEEALLTRAPQGLRVLVAEDNGINRMMLRKMLEKGGHRVVEAENGRCALDVLQRAACDIVLMDIQMAEMDGLAATRAIRSDRSGAFDPAIPVIAVTAYAQPAEQKDFIAAGIDACLTKPIAIQELHALLERFAPPAPGDADDSTSKTGTPLPVCQ